MKKEWLDRILQAGIDAGKEIEKIPSQKDISEAIYEYVCEHYKKGDTSAALGALYTIYHSISEAIPSLYDRARGRNDAGFTLSALNANYIPHKEVFSENTESNKHNTSSNRYLTTQEIAKELNITPQTVNGWIRNKILPATKIGKSYRIRYSDFEIFKSERTNLSNTGGNGKRVKIISDEYFPVSPITDED